MDPAENPGLATGPKPSWRLSRGERAGLILWLCIIIGFGANLEQRTALRRSPMTDLGVFSCAAWAAWHGENIYTITDWHGWHYQYPPTLAILFVPLANPLPEKLPPLAPGEWLTEANAPWGYGVVGHRFFGLHRQNVRFFCIVAAWYLISVALVTISVHALACVLEGRSLREPPPDQMPRRRRWWALRILPVLVCIGSLGTEYSRGQVDVLMLAAIALSLYLAARSRTIVAGLFLAIPATLKMFPPFVLLYPIWRRQWKMAAGMAAGLALGLALIPAATLGPARTVDLYRTWMEVLAKPALGRGTDTSRAKELTGMTSTDNQSLLAFIHNWQYHQTPRSSRPAEAAPAARQVVYVTGVLMLVGVAFVSGTRRRDTPRELLLVVGLLISLWLVISPIVHNFYYFLLIPLVAALLDGTLPAEMTRPSSMKLPLAIIIFMLVDIAARLPGIGPWLRDAGAPFLSVIWMSCSGALELLKGASGDESRGKQDFREQTSPTSHEDHHGRTMPQISVPRPSGAA